MSLGAGAEQNKELLSANTKLTADNKDLKNKIEQIEEDHEEERRQRMRTAPHFIFFGVRVDLGGRG